MEDISLYLVLLLEVAGSCYEFFHIQIDALRNGVPFREVKMKVPEMQHFVLHHFICRMPVLFLLSGY